MQTWFGSQAGGFLASIPNHIGVYAIIIFVLFVLVSVLISLGKRMARNVFSFGVTLVCALATFLIVGSLYSILPESKAVQNAVATLLEKLPELGASVDGALAVSKYVVSLVAIPAMFLIIYGLFNLGFTLYVFVRNKKQNGQGSAIGTLFSVLKIAVAVVAAVILCVVYFYPDRSFLDLIALPPIAIAVFGAAKAILTFFKYAFPSVRKTVMAMEESVPPSGAARKVVGGLFGAVTGVIIFVMMFFPILAVADLATVGVQAIPEDALACYEKAEETADDGEQDIVESVFHYTVEVKKYSDSYSKTFVSKLYPYPLHNIIAPVDGARRILRSSVVLGSYYYCEEQGAEFTDADTRLTEAIGDVVGDDSLNDVLQSLFCQATSQTLSNDAEQRELIRDSLSAGAKLSEVESLDPEAQSVESEKLSTAYQALCRLMISVGENENRIDFSREQLILFGELMDAMNDSYSFSGTIEPLLTELYKNEYIGQFMDPKEAIDNVSRGEYTYAIYMEIVADRIEDAAP